MTNARGEIYDGDTAVVDARRVPQATGIWGSLTGLPAVIKSSEAIHVADTAPDDPNQASHRRYFLVKSESVSRIRRLSPPRWRADTTSEQETEMNSIWVKAVM